MNFCLLDRAMYALRCCCRRLEEEDTEDKVLRMDLDDIEASLCDAQYEISDIFFVTLEDRVCVVCHENCKSVVFAPCNHLCVCAICAERVERCPLCQGPIDEKRCVFL